MVTDFDNLMHPALQNQQTGMNHFVSNKQTEDIKIIKNSVIFNRFPVSGMTMMSFIHWYVGVLQICGGSMIEPWVVRE